ncbi:MAG: NlpC/P60 family protein [Brevibacterium sp.]|nr:NlpC/P60 family protein [Brevibacterium sp.]MDN5832565.1 NlpC/P60 family protein [Brevibacterium sp.]MDN5875188.1 NlpC/P60 family protein [Brevibacterium sp.]MDN5908251.1 NlpC/P60 family protein [Brevibacterium sp.]MDN6157974.1 NlpC/P60 family protein [Brevibacterium sp.]
MKYLLPTVAGCASVALVGTLAVTAPTAFAASTEPEVTQEALSVSEEGLSVPGARASSDSNANVANQSATSNLPNIFKSQTAVASTQVPSVVNVSSGASAAASTGAVHPVSAGLSSPEGGGDAAASEDSTPKADPSAPADESATKDDEASTDDTSKDDKSKDSETSEDSKDSEDISGSVRQKTEDGVNIALISDVLDVPSKNPSLVGFTFSESKSNIRIQVRVKSGSDWGTWQSLDEEKQEQAKNEGSEPFTVNRATGVQMRILGDKAPSDAELVLVDPKHNPNDAAAVADNDPVEIEPQSSEPSGGAADTSETTPGSTSAAASTETVAASDQAKVTNQNYVPGTSSVNNVAKSEVPKPKIGSRKSWGAKSYKGSPDYASGIKQAVVHHTAGSNSYSAEDVPSILRGIQSYHQSGRGWNDVGYNVIADKYGRLWHARGGDIKKAVIGAHVAGHNTGTFGISVIGSYDKKAPPKKTRDAVASAIAWKLSMDGVKVSKSTVVGHRDLGNTSCPGDAFYAKMGEIRSTASDIMKSGDLPSDDKKDDDKKDDDKKDDDKKDDDKKETPKPKTEIEKYAADHKKELGKATGKEHDVKGVDGARARAYEKGNVYWSKKTGAYHLTGAIKNSYKGDVVTQLGLPTAQAKDGLKDGGAAQSFQKGKIYWSEATGAHYTKGTLLKYWGDKGTVKGHLGYPESNPVYKDGRGEQLFEGARLVWAEGYGTTEFSPTGTIGGGVVDNNGPGDADDANASGGADDSAPPGDSATDGGSAADSGEGSTDDEDAKGDDKAKDDDKPKDDEPKADKPKDDEPKADKPKDDDKKDKPSKAEKIQAQRDSIIKEAKAHLGVRYVWAGTSPTNGWDCSGYTQYVYGKHGIDLPRTTSQQRNAGKVIPTEDAKPGDLIWIPGHIGIISETKGMMYDAGSSRTNTTKRSYSWMLNRGAKVIRVVG